MKKAVLILLLGISTACVTTAQADESCFRIVSYNVENFFDATHDTLKNDNDFLPNGKYRWNESRFHRKAQQIARVISMACAWNKAAVVGLCEVENAHCLSVLCRKTSNYGYRFLHFEGPDKRGIEVALLYDDVLFHPIDSAALPVYLGDEQTRDILYAAGVLPTGDTLHIYQCHLPSMGGGKADTEWKRQAAKAVIQKHVDSLLAIHPQALVAVMGDMNSRPKEDLKGLHNRMTAMDEKGQGTYRYRGIWSCLDQIYLSPALDSVAEAGIYLQNELIEEDRRYLDYKPKRTFNGFRYNAAGFSDHLPVYLDFCLPL